MKRKEPHLVADKPHKNFKVIMEDTRMPLQKGATKAFPSPKKHFELASKWQNQFAIMESRANELRTKT